MTIRNLLLCTCLAGSCVSALAADVQMYGVLDYSLGSIYQKIGNQASTQSFSLDSARKMGPRVGLKGGESLGAGLRLAFVLEAGFDGDTGAIFEMDKRRDRLFGREAQISLISDWGTLAFGRMGNLASGNGTYGLTGIQTSPFGPGFGQGAMQNVLFGHSRFDNTVIYKSPAYAGVTGYAQYTFQIDGDDSASTGDRNRAAALGITYRSKTLNLTGVIEQLQMGNAASAERKDPLSVTLASNYDLGCVKLYATAQYMKNVARVGMKDGIGAVNAGAAEALTGYAGILAAKIPAWGGNLMVQASYLDADDNSVADTKVSRWIGALGYNYDLTKRTALYAGLNYGEKKTRADAQLKTKIAQGFAGISHRF